MARKQNKAILLLSSDPKQAASLYLGTMTAVVCLIIAPLHTQWASRDELLDAMKATDPQLYEKMLRHTVIGMKVSPETGIRTGSGVSVEGTVRAG